MNLKLFFSWQAETNNKFNRFFILDCINQAVKNLKSDTETEKFEINVLEGTNGEPGVTPPADVIMQERIPTCDIFIGDVSIVNKLPDDIMEALKAANHKHRLGPNLNVMIEFGIAHRSLGPKKIIFVMNNEYGAPKENAEFLPFDIRAFRWPIEYKYNDTSIKEKVTKSLVGSLTNAIKETALYAVQNYQQKYRPFMTWTKWGEFVLQPQPYVSNERLDQITTEIKKALLEGDVNIRFLGLPGLGKTRILYEMFKPEDRNDASALLSGRILYVDSNRNDHNQILTKMEDIVSDASKHILIIDNCSLKLYREAIKLVKNKKRQTSLITISPDPEEILSNKISGINYHILKKEDLVSIVDQILERDFGSLSQVNIIKIKEFAQGIPMMAVLLGESAIGGEEFIGKLEDKDLLDKLLGDQAKDPENRKLLQTSALFNYFGFDDEVKEEFVFLAANRELTVTDHSAQKSEDVFRTLVNHYLKREIFEQKGRFLGMRPFPLALSLAVEWLDNCSSERLLRVITAIATLEDPHRVRLANAFSDQMKYLGYNEKAVTIFNKITGPGSPFDNAEVLNTELGSRFFRSFVEVIPVNISENLYRNFAFKSIAELLRVEEGRRNLVWVLENLCFGKETFEKSIRVLFAFAAAENETWGNNATGQLMQLFSPHLAGTEVPLLERVPMIEWALSRKEIQFRQLAIKAIGRGLSFIHSTRIVGAENQGMLTRKDHVPANIEIREYWAILLKLLTAIILTEPDLAELGAEIFSNSVREIVYVGNGDLLIPHMRRIVETKDNNWNHLLDNIRLTLHYEKNISDAVYGDLVNLTNKLNKTDFKSKYLRALDHKMDTFPDQTFSYEKFRQYTEYLAIEFLESDLDWEQAIPMFYKGRQYNVFYFGKGIAESLKDRPEDLRQFVDISLNALNRSERADHDASVLGAVYRFSAEDTQQYVKEKIKELPRLIYLLFYFKSLEDDPYNNVDELFNLIDSGDFGLEEFVQFRSNGPIYVDENTLANFSRKLFAYGDDGYKISYQLIFGMTYLNENKSPVLIQILKECVLQLGIFNQSFARQDYHQWWEAIRLILNHEGDSDFASTVNQAVIESITYKNSYHLDNTMQRIYEALMRLHFKKVWPLLSENLQGENEHYVKFYGLKHILGSGISPVKRAVGVLFEGDMEEIFKWCEEYPTIAPVRLAELVPIFAPAGQEQKSSWHPYARKLIDQFGENKEVLEAIYSNINNYSWTGTIIPYLENQLDLMNELIAHPKMSVAEWSNRYKDFLRLEIERQAKLDEEGSIM